MIKIGDMRYLVINKEIIKGVFKGNVLTKKGKETKAKVFEVVDNKGSFINVNIGQKKPIFKQEVDALKHLKELSLKEQENRKLKELEKLKGDDLERIYSHFEEILKDTDVVQRISTLSEIEFNELKDKVREDIRDILRNTAYKYKSERWYNDRCYGRAVPMEEEYQELVEKYKNENIEDFLKEVYTGNRELNHFYTYWDEIYTKMKEEIENIIYKNAIENMKTYISNMKYASVQDIGFGIIFEIFSEKQYIENIVDNLFYDMGIKLSNIG